VDLKLFSESPWRLWITRCYGLHMSIPSETHVDG
jgi:hypothetical protein